MRANGPVIRFIRERDGMTVTQLAQKTGIERTCLSRIERGQRVGTPEQIKAIAGVFGLPISAIVETAA